MQLYLFKYFRSPDCTCGYQIFQEIESQKYGFSIFNLMIKLVSTQFIRRLKVYKHYFNFWSPEKYFWSLELSGGQIIISTSDLLKNGKIISDFAWHLFYNLFSITFKCVIRKFLSGNLLLYVKFYNSISWSKNFQSPVSIPWNSISWTTL